MIAVFAIMTRLMTTQPAFETAMMFGAETQFETIAVFAAMIPITTTLAALRTAMMFGAGR